MGLRAHFFFISKQLTSKPSSDGGGGAGGPVGHKLTTREPCIFFYFFRVGGPEGHKHRLCASICVGICGNNT